ncbi:MAG: 2-hydroxyhepta-2,4-diene-1,7-dioate isomerase [Rhodospirillales bacterium CG15_BIG_FIL_POST_REV_8_21_14_020_66_15]|nr:MAG: 2-hydroxyhepta-2,4-diene-1,7-dioate isomerase [Rhodospirillales bacterium CG15_BIG_FIL_POST_REV_8_21_14_020_66_15]
MTLWIRYERQGAEGFGILDGDVITVHSGDMFRGAQSTGETVALADVRVLPPVKPGKIVALWNNYDMMREKMNGERPAEPLWFIKTNNSVIGTGAAIERPASYDGKVVYEGELGIVIGKRCKNVPEAEALDYVFGYTCVNDVTAIEILKRDGTFDQWTRCKSFDTFGPLGPVVATGLDPMKLTVKTILNGQERQNYPVSDMLRTPAKLISEISHDVTLEPGDVIACGTNVGVGTMKDPSNTVEIVIEGIGTLSNTFNN